MCKCALMLQKIPPSGGAPSYKLTLPHQIVNRRLHHLVDAGFELATSVTSQQTWQGSIAPRRNKDRSEYILQVTSATFPPGSGRPSFNANIGDNSQRSCIC